MPRRMLAPPVLTTSLMAAGFSQGMFDGAVASTHVVREEPHPQVVALVELGDVEQSLEAVSCSEVCLHAPVEERVVVPGGVGEPPVACRRLVRGRPEHHASQFLGEVERLGGDRDRPGRQGGTERCTLRAGQETMQGAAGGVDQEGVERGAEVAG